MVPTASIVTADDHDRNRCWTPPPLYRKPTRCSRRQDGLGPRCRSISRMRRITAAAVDVVRCQDAAGIVVLRNRTAASYATAVGHRRAARDVVDECTARSGIDVGATLRLICLVFSDVIIGSDRRPRALQVVTRATGGFPTAAAARPGSSRSFRPAGGRRGAPQLRGRTSISSGIDR